MDMILLGMLVRHSQLPNPTPPELERYIFKDDEL